jgi:hypothetical protein
MENASTVQKNGKKLTQEEKNNIFEKLNAEVKIKFNNDEIIGFNPFKVCCSIPAKFTLKNYTNGKKIEWREEFEFKNYILRNGVETNNIKYLEEADIKTSHLQLNLEL